MRDFKSAYDRCGSIATLLAEADATIHVRYAPPIATKALTRSETSLSADSPSSR